MTRLHVLLLRTLALFANHRRDEELAAEIDTHLDLLAEEHARRGLTRDQARLAAHRAFGGVFQVKEAFYHQRRLPSIDALAHDLRHALRRLHAKPATAVLAIALLALAIGLTSAMFTVVDAFILRPAPFRDPASLSGWASVRPMRTSTSTSPCRSSEPGAVPPGLTRCMR